MERDGRALDVDVAVIGADIAGLSTALSLKDAGLRVAVLEGRRGVRGDHGAYDGEGQCAARLDYDTLRSTFDADAARAYAEANVAAVDLIETLVREHAIECDWERRPAYADTVTRRAGRAGERPR